MLSICESSNEGKWRDTWNWHPYTRTETGQWTRMAENYECTCMRKVNNMLMWKKQLGLLPQHFLCPSLPYRHSNSTPGLHHFYLLYSGLTLFLVPAASLIGPLTCLLWHCSPPVQTLRLILNLTCGWGLVAFNLFIMYCFILFFHQLHTFPSKRTKVDHGPDRAHLWGTLTLTWQTPAWLSFQAFFEVSGNVSEGPHAMLCYQWQKGK